MPSAVAWLSRRADGYTARAIVRSNVGGADELLALAIVRSYVACTDSRVGGRRYGS